MVLISITSDPNDFLSAPPPGVFRRRSIIKPVSNTSNGNVCKEQHDSTKKRKNSLQIMMSTKGELPVSVSEPCLSDVKEYEDLESKLLSIYAEKNEKPIETKRKAEGEDEWKYNNEAGKEGITLLMAACQQGLEHDVRTILRRRPGLARLKDRTGKTAVHYCADSQSSACLDQILDLHPTLLDRGDNEGCTPLILAVLAGNTNIIRHLVARNARIDAVDSEQHSAVHWAVVCGELEALDVLCNSGAQINTPDIHGAYPIHYAAQMCGPSTDHNSSPEKSRTFLVVLRKLLARGADPNVLDKDLRPPVLWAASAGSVDAFLALVNYGASASSIDKDGLSALHCAASRGHRECLSILISLCGAAVNLRDLNGCTSLFYTVTLGYVECTELLLECGAETDIKDRKGRTPVHCGAAKGQLETLKVMRRYNAQMWEVNNKGEAPLHLAVRSGRRDLIRWLLCISPESVNLGTTDGMTALHVAAATNNTEVCTILLEFKASINKQMMSNGKRTTPLDIALCRGNKACVRFLQSNGGIRASKLTKRSSAKFCVIPSSDSNIDKYKYKGSDSSKSRNSSKTSKINPEFLDSETNLNSTPRSQELGNDLRFFPTKTTGSSVIPSQSPRFIKSPFQLPTNTNLDMCDICDEQHGERGEELGEEVQVLSYQPSRERRVASIENINDETIGKQMMIEKHLQHQRRLKEQGSASFLSGNHSRCQSSEFEKISVLEHSGNFDTKAISEIYKLSGTLKFPQNRPGGLTRSSSKELRKLRQEKFYRDELKILREALKHLKPLNCNVALIVKRIIDNFNKKIIHYVGCRTYTGPISPTFYEKHLLGELCKVYSVSHPSDLLLGWKPGLGKVTRSHISQESFTASSSSKRLVLPHIQQQPPQPASDGVLEVRHGGVSKLIKIPQYDSQTEQQISVTFTIKPKLRTIPSVRSLTAL